MYQTFQAIDMLIDKINLKAERLRAEVGTVRGPLREIEYLFYRISSLLSRMGLPPEIDKAINTLQRLILTIRLVHSAMIYLQTGTPYGLLLGLLTIGGATISVGGLTGVDPTGMQIRGREA